MFTMNLALSVIIEVILFCILTWIVLQEAFLSNNLNVSKLISGTAPLIMIIELYLSNIDRFMSILIVWRENLPLQFDIVSFIVNYFALLIIVLGFRWFFTLARLTLNRRRYDNVWHKTLFLIELILLPIIAYTEFAIFRESLITLNM